MGKALRNKLLKVGYSPGQKVKVMLGKDWCDAEVVSANKKTVVVRTLWSKTKHRRVSVVEKLAEDGGIAKDIANDFIAATDAVPKPKTVLEPYTVHGTKVIKLSRIRVKPIKGEVTEGTIKITDTKPTYLIRQLETTDMFDSEAAQDRASELEQQIIEEASTSEPEYEGPGLGKDEAPLVERSAVDVLAELEKMLS